MYKPVLIPLSHASFPNLYFSALCWAKDKGRITANFKSSPQQTKGARTIEELAKLTLIKRKLI